jgi:hypothetical protein
VSPRQFNPPISHALDKYEFERATSRRRKAGSRTPRNNLVFPNLDGQVTKWLFGAAPPKAKAGLPKFKTPRFTRTVSQWLNLLIETGFSLERIEEPRPSDETVRACPDVQDAQVVAYFIHIRARKLTQGTATPSVSNRVVSNNP